MSDDPFSHVQFRGHDIWNNAQWFTTPTGEADGVVIGDRAQLTWALTLTYNTLVEGPYGTPSHRASASAYRRGLIVPKAGSTYAQVRDDLIDHAATSMDYIPGTVCPVFFDLQHNETFGGASRDLVDRDTGSWDDED